MDPLLPRRLMGTEPLYAMAGTAPPIPALVMYRANQPLVTDSEADPRSQ